MPLVDFCGLDGSRYMGFRVPDACTVAQWKCFMELGGTGDKVLYAKRVICYRDPERSMALGDADALPAQPAPVFLGGPGSVVTMLELALKKQLGAPVPAGRFLACASPSCDLLVYSKPTFGGYCCMQCCRGSGHGRECERVNAPEGTPKAESTWMPDDPNGKYITESISQGDLRKDDEDWAQPNDAEKKEQRALVHQTNVFIGPFVDYSQTGAADAIKLYKSAEHGWSLDYDPNFVCELLYEGFYTRGLEFAVQRPPVQVLVISWDRKLSVWDFNETHVSRQVRKRAKHYSLTMDRAFDDVLLGCVREHGENWLFRGWRWMARKLRGEGYTGSKDISVSIHSFELWDKDLRLVAGDIGAFIGGVYTSMTGFHERHSRSAGEVQMVLAASLLHQAGFAWVDLGQVLPYKESLGSKVVTRQEYLARLHRDRDKHIEGKIDASERFEGSTLLAHISLVAAGAPRRKPPKPKRLPVRTAAALLPDQPLPPAGEREGKAREIPEDDPAWRTAAALAAKRQVAPPPSGPPAAAEARTEEEGTGEGPLWRVVGGKDKGGIIVRCQEATSSAALPARLATGAMVRELRVAGNRLHYRRLAGTGPDSGWVSIRIEDRTLVEPWSGGVAGDQQLHD